MVSKCSFILHIMDSYLSAAVIPVLISLIDVLFQEPSSFSILFQTQEQVRFYSVFQSC